MAKRELSSTVRNLKFMQRVAQKEGKAKKEEEKDKVEEVVSNGIFPSRTATRKCVIIMEGDPHPEAMRGRMSFLSFNPSVDKLNGEETNPPEHGPAATSSARESETSDRRDITPQARLSSPQVQSISNNGSNGDLKRKSPDVSKEEASYPHKSPKNAQGDRPLHSNRGSDKQRLDWNVLRPSKSHNKKK
ncbi:OLC1v1007656C1 [Oldenlandia corymbosa var. corymbosa]|uniref:OLC1v1007656C1 n=1 Tax=Oldenlandia corymbosa var. corymbosa TaxID=529605 RepID=A0AAV1DK66_OLDCO|nr:OLC1v1007656C1 [Oldenlandia corymbosa var. corymbosa]